MKRRIKVDVCGDLPTACNHLLKLGVVNIDKYHDAAEIRDESEYHLILVYAPQAEGLLDTHYSRCDVFEHGKESIPLRLLGEPCCRSALVELSCTVESIEKALRRKLV